MGKKNKVWVIKNGKNKKKQYKICADREEMIQITYRKKGCEVHGFASLEDARQYVENKGKTKVTAETKKKPRIYVVEVGRKTGIYPTAEEAVAQTKGFKNGRFIRCKNMAEAEKRLENLQIKSSDEKYTNLPFVMAYTDGSFDRKTKSGGCGCVLCGDNWEFEYSGIVTDKNFISLESVGTELWAAMQAVEKAKIKGIKRLCICYDFEGVAELVKQNLKNKTKGANTYRSFMINAMKEMDIEFTHVKAHSGNVLNDRADKLAKMAIS